MQPSYRGFPQQPPQRSPHGAVARRGIGPMVSGGAAQASMTPNQMATHQAALDRQSEIAKRRSRKPTDRTIPEGVEECVIGDGVQRYRELRDTERKLDAAMVRKRVDIQDSRARSVRRYRTLRIWISNTSEGEPWQSDGLDADTTSGFNFISSTDPCYRLKIEGKLLNDDNEEDSDDDLNEDEDMDEATGMVEKGSGAPRTERTLRRSKFSHFFKSMSVDFDRNKPKYNGESGIEWKKPATSPNVANPPNAADFDQLEFRRSAHGNVNITIILVRDEAQERFNLAPGLIEILDVSEATRTEVITGVYDYIQSNGLQEEDEKRTFRCDELLTSLLKRDIDHLPHLYEHIAPQMTALEPIKLDYTIRTDEEYHKDPQPTIYDIRVLLDDPLQAKLHAFNTNPTYPAQLREIGAYNDQLATIVQAVSHSKGKHTFMASMSKDPVNFMKTWMSSQKRDLEVLLGEATRGGGEDASGEEWRRGGASGVWGTENVRESVNGMLTARPR